MDALNEGLLGDLKERFRRATDAKQDQGVQDVIDALDKALSDAPTTGPMYGQGVRRLRRWCRKSGRLPSSCVLADAVGLASTHPFSSSALSDVYRGRSRVVEVAVKVIRQHANDHESVRKSFRNEVVTWKYLRHPNIVPFLGISNLFPICVVSEWMSGGTIGLFFVAHPAMNRSKHIQQILHGLEFMHSLGVIHGDLKAVNILVDEHRNARLVDFGMTTVLLHSTQGTATGGGVGGTLRYIAPELHAVSDPAPPESPKLTVLSDIYALAMTIWELFSGQIPFPHLRADHAVLVKVLAGERPPKPTASNDIGFTDSVWNVMQRGWAAEPNHRATLADFHHAVSLEILRLRELAVVQTEERLRNLDQKLLEREQALHASEASFSVLQEDMQRRESTLTAERANPSQQEQASVLAAQELDRTKVTSPTSDTDISPPELDDEGRCWEVPNEAWQRDLKNRMQSRFAQLVGDAKQEHMEALSMLGDDDREQRAAAIAAHEEVMDGIRRQARVEFDTHLNGEILQRRFIANEQLNVHEWRLLQKHQLLLLRETCSTPTGSPTPCKLIDLPPPLKPFPSRPLPPSRPASLHSLPDTPPAAQAVMHPKPPPSASAIPSTSRLLRGEMMPVPSMRSPLNPNVP